MQSNIRIETALLHRAIDEGFQQLVKENPKLAEQPNLDVIKNVYGHGFIAGSNYGISRVAK